MPTLTFKVSSAEARTIRSRARKEKATVSAYLRKLATGSKRASGKLVLKKHPVSGLTYNAAAQEKVSQASIDAALADFP